MKKIIKILIRRARKALKKLQNRIPAYLLLTALGILLFLLIIFIDGLLFNGYLLSLLITTAEASTIITILGIFATVSVTFLTLLFAIAAINASFQARHDNDVGVGDYPLKLLIKVDLQNSAFKTIIPQLLFIIIAFYVQDSILTVVWLVVLVILVGLLISTLWNTTNSVYYSIIQYNYDGTLNKNLKGMSLDLENVMYASGVKSYAICPYDVYAIKKTLFPNIFDKIYADLHRQDLSQLSKTDIVNLWNNGFEKEVDLCVTNLEKNIRNMPLVDVLNSNNENIQEMVNEVLKKLRPKVQAPEKITKICLDLMYQEIHSTNYTSPYPSPENFKRCMLLLHSHIKYVESRQDERDKHNARINRGRYSNQDDTHMYMLYGYVLCHLGMYELSKKQIVNTIKYYDFAISAYESAQIVNLNNTVAQWNIKYLRFQKKIVENYSSKQSH